MQTVPSTVDDNMSSRNSVKRLVPAAATETPGVAYTRLSGFGRDVEDMELGLVRVNTAPGISDTSSSGILSPASSVTSGSPTALVSVVPAPYPTSNDAVSGSPPATAPAAAVDIEAPPSTQAPSLLAQSPITRPFSWKLVNYCLIPLALPLLAGWWLAALLLAAAATFTVLPSLLLAQRLYWACPFIPHIWRSEGIRGKYGVVGSWLLRLQFEGAHCMTVLARLLSLPLRPHLPHFYILGFPKCGTTSLASYLKVHPALSGLTGMPGNEIFGKESHFFGGLLGRGTTHSALLYRSFFPTILSRWWAEAVLGVERWMCFDACPTYACLPHVAARAKALTPNAKLVVMVRDPAAGVFSAETMLRNMGVPLAWSLTAPLQGGGDGAADPRFQFSADDDKFWRELEALDPDAPLPADLSQRFYLQLHSYLMAGRYADRLRPWLQAFGADNVLLVDHKAFVAQPEVTVLQVLDFLGADTTRYDFKQQPARMVGDYKGARIDPGVAAWLNKTWFADSNAAIADMLAGGKAPGAASWP